MTTMTRRRLLLITMVTTLVVLGAGIWLLWPRPSAISPENRAKIEKGMTLADVEEILGGSARNESNMPDNFINDAFVNSDSMKMGPGAMPFYDKRWAISGYVIIVDFDDSGRVIRHTDFAYNADRSFLDKLRRWFGR
jgi:hypothetical protein